MFKKRGQAAVEYLVTYGWAFLAILATVGVMSYFGLLSPGKYVPDSCEFGNQLKCKDHFVEDFITDQISIRFENNFEDDIEILRVFGDDIIIENINKKIAKGDIKKISFDTARPLFPGEKESFNIIIEFRRDDGTPTPTTPQHNVSGRIFTQVQDSSLGII